MAPFTSSEMVASVTTGDLAPSVMTGEIPSVTTAGMIFFGKDT